MKTRCLALTVLLALAAALPAAAESAAPALAALKESNARLRRFVLDNGMTCLVKEDSSAPMVAIQIWVRCGSVNEQEFLGGGLSHYVEHMIFKGTPARPVGAITRQIHDAGGDINAYTGQERTVFHATIPAARWTLGLEVLADAAMNATFPEGEWKKEKDVILSEFAMRRDQPDVVLGEMLWATAYRIHPYRHPIAGYEDIFRTMTRENLLEYFRRNYTPDNMITVVVGDFDADEAEALLRKTFAGFARRPRPPAVLPAEPPPLAPRFERRAGPYEVTRLLWSWPTVSLNHPDAAALDVLSTIVGSGRSSRLNREIREKRRLVYEIDAGSVTPLDPGLFVINATFDPTNEAAVIRAIQEQADTWSREVFDGEELEKARRQVLVDELSGLQDMAGQAFSYAAGEFYAADPLFSERYIEAVGRVTAEDVRAAAARYLKPETRTLVILGPAETNAAAAAAPARPGTDVRRIALSNGVPVIVREDHRLPFVYLCAALKGGLLTESETDNGITQLMSDLLPRGTASRPADRIAAEVETLGGYLAPFCGRNSFGLQARCLAQDAPVFADLFADCLLRPSFPEDELQKQRDAQLAAIQQQREQPFFVAEEKLRETLFPGHPYRWTMQGTAATVAGLTRDALAARHRSHVVSGNLVLAIFGDVTDEQARELAERIIAGLPAGPAPEPKPAPAYPHLPAHVKQREPREQAIVLIGYPSVSLRDPRVDALAVIEDALSGLSSDLGTEIREKRGLAYAVGAFDRPGLEPGLFALYAGTSAGSAADVEKLMNREIDRIAGKGLREEEIARAANQIAASNQSRLQNNADLAQTCALNELYGLGFDYSFGIEQRLKALTPESIRAAASSIFKKENQAVSVVLPGQPDAAPEAQP